MPALRQTIFPGQVLAEARGVIMLFSAFKQWRHMSRDDCGFDRPMQHAYRVYQLAHVVGLGNDPLVHEIVLLWPPAHVIDEELDVIHASKIAEARAAAVDFIHV